MTSGSGRRTRIVATLGPACRDPAVMRRMVEEGLDWARLNFSRGDLEHQRRAVETLRVVSAAAGRRVRLMAELGGAKVRIAALAEPVAVEAGQVVTIGSGRAVPEAIPITVPRALAGLSVGGMLALDNGAIELEVIETAPGWVRCRVLTGRKIRSHQSVVIAGWDDLSALSDKDEEDLAAALELGVDAVALSRVRRREDAMALRTRLPEGMLAAAKIEDADGLSRLEGILEDTDAVVIVRGSLGFSLPPQRVPLVQKDVLGHCARRGRVGVVATELFRSMLERPTPLRVEVADVATAILDGADMLTLTEETAVGANPVESVAELRQVIEEVEDSVWFRAQRRPPLPPPWVD